MVYELTEIDTKLFLWETPNGYVENFREGIRKMGWESRIGKIADYSILGSKKVAEARELDFPILTCNGIDI